MKSELIGTKVRLVYPLRAIAVAAEGKHGLILHVPKSATLSITEVANDITGRLVADWEDKRILLFEKDLKSALDGTATSQLNARKALD